jgi:hypothetical protein
MDALFSGPKFTGFLTDAWEWTGAKDSGGYGKFADRRKCRAAHKFLWKTTMGLPYPKGYELHHKCGNRACLNPAHLELVTRSERKPSFCISFSATPPFNHFLIT